MTWDGITWWWNDPPCARRIGTGSTTESFDGEAPEHENVLRGKHREKPRKVILRRGIGPI